MPKLHAEFTAPLNLLVQPAMKQMLIAVAYFRGEGGSFAGPARDFIRAGMDQWLAGLSAKDRARFEEIMESVRVADSYRKDPGSPKG